MSLTTTVLGYPRIGAQRQLKRALESFWKGKSDGAALHGTATQVQQANYCAMLKAGLSELPVGDFSLYDQVLDAIVLLGAIPQRYNAASAVQKGFDPAFSVYFAIYFAIYFAMARGCQQRDMGIDLRAMEMTKWFDTNYHSIVPELGPEFLGKQNFMLNNLRLRSQLEQAEELLDDSQHAPGRQGMQDVQLRPVILGPVSFLLLSKGLEQPLRLLPRLLPVYQQLLAELTKYKRVQRIQVEEPFLALDLSQEARDAYRDAYRILAPQAKLFISSYFAPLRENAPLILEQGIDTLHLDLMNHSESELASILAVLPQTTRLSLGIVDGRNVWRNPLRQSLARLQEIANQVGTERLTISSSCSLLHCPVDLRSEKQLEPEVYQQLAFAQQKLEEIVVLARGLGGLGGLGGLAQDAGDIADALAASDAAIAARKSSTAINDAAVQRRLAAITAADAQRQSPYAERRQQQAAKLKLPLLPTTTIGSFPQTAAVRRQRSAWRKGELTQQQYHQYLETEAQKCIRLQEAIGLDVLVHGEFERSDMVEYFGQQLQGIAFTANGWVQSYGSRCVRPPLIFGDISRPQPMTVDWMRFAQRQTTKPMKAMLTGPITILKWSFVRNDQPLSQTCLQLALALRDEVRDLEQAGLPIVQIDEPAIREALPLRRADQAAYLDWAVQSFRLSAGGAKDQTQIHTHMCYSEFNEIMEAIAALDADVISIEASRSQLDILQALQESRYPREIGLGVYDIHSPRVPQAEEMAEVVQRARAYLEAWQIWINPDCGLKTRDWPETEGALRAMVAAAKRLRRELEGGATD